MYKVIASGVHISWGHPPWRHRDAFISGLFFPAVPNTSLLCVFTNLRFPGYWSSSTDTRKWLQNRW